MANKLSTKLLVLLVVFSAAFGKVAARSNSEYVFENEYKTSWQQHIKGKIIDEYIFSDYVHVKVTSKCDPELNELKIRLGFASNSMTRDQLDVFNTLSLKLYKKYYYELIDSLESCDVIALDSNEARLYSAELGQEIDILKKEYCKTKYKVEDFCYLIRGTATFDNPTENFKFIDLYYRDENNMPTIKYDTDKDQVLIHSYWYKTGQMQWHPIDYGMEQIIWKTIVRNPFNDTELVKASIDAFVKKFFAE